MNPIDQYVIVLERLSTANMNWSRSTKTSPHRVGYVFWDSLLIEVSLPLEMSMVQSSNYPPF